MSSLLLFRLLISGDSLIEASFNRQVSVGKGQEALPLLMFLTGHLSYTKLWSRSIIALGAGQGHLDLTRQRRHQLKFCLLCSDIQRRGQRKTPVLDGVVGELDKLRSRPYLSISL